MMMLIMSVIARSHGSGVGDCARYGGKGGVGCLEIHQTFVKCLNWTSESIYKGVNFVHFLLCRGPIGPCEAPYVGVKSVFLIDCFVTKYRFARSNLFTRWASHYILLSTSENKSKAIENSLPKPGRCESRIDLDQIAKMLLNK